MKMKLTLISILFFAWSGLIRAQVYINDDFSVWPQGWTFYSSPCNGQYTGVHDTLQGSTSPSAKINKAGCLAPCAASFEAGFSKSVALTPAAKQFQFNVSYEASSGTASSSVTNARLKIYDHTNETWIINACLICGGSANSGWRQYMNTFDVSCQPTDSITIYLYTVDVWTTTPWCKTTRFDNPYLEVTQTTTTPALALGTITPVNPTCMGCSDGSIAISPTGGVPPYTITWTPSVGNLNANMIENLPADTFSVCITDSLMCQVCEDVLLTDMPVGITERSIQHVSLYPNPLTSSSVLELPANTDYTSLELRIYDVTGREMRRMDFNSNVLEIGRGDLNEGLYLFEISSHANETLHAGRLIIQ